MGFSIYLEQALLNHVLRGDQGGTDLPQPLEIWMSLHDDPPNEVGANEIAGGDYARALVTFDAPSGKVALNSNQQQFLNLPTTTVKYVGLWDDETAGNFLYQGELLPHRSVTAGDNITFNAGNFGVRHD